MEKSSWKCIIPTPNGGNYLLRNTTWNFTKIEKKWSLVTANTQRPAELWEISGVLRLMRVMRKMDVSVEETTIVEEIEEDLKGFIHDMEKNAVKRRDVAAHLLQRTEALSESRRLKNIQLEERLRRRGIVLSVLIIIIHIILLAWLIQANL